MYQRLSVMEMATDVELCVVDVEVRVLECSSIMNHSLLVHVVL